MNKLNDKIIQQIQDVLNPHLALIDGSKNHKGITGVTLFMKISESDGNGNCATSGVNVTYGCGCSREDFIKEIGQFVLKLQSIDKTFDTN